MPDTGRQISWTTATLLVVATMVGTGVFTTTGFLIQDLASNSAVILSWVVGGSVALCGALCYAELAAALPESGGEYHLLSRIFHPSVGFVAGWVSLIVGFAAPIAGSSLAFGYYLQTVFPWVHPTSAGVILLVLVTAINLGTVRRASRFQDLFTALKIALIIAFIVGGLVYGESRYLMDGSFAGMGESLVSAPFAVALIFVSYAYSGWNTSAYIAGEVHDPARGLPFSLITGTLIVIALYVSLNAVFLMSAESSALAGKVEIGAVSATRLFGTRGGTAISLLIALGLISTVGAMVMTGPRIYARMGQDFGRLAWLQQDNADKNPVSATLLQSALAALMILSASFESLLTYVGLTLSLVAGLTVAGVIWLRIREPELQRPYRTMGYPFTPLLFIALSGWMIIYAVQERPVVTFAALGTIVSGLLAYWAVLPSKRDRAQ
ncbi:MAG TPA: amino acid permease [Myxococcales bacterium]|nr:amino acid permease [Myxococcales bacterium]HIN86267.1 amino acid permease [Myxococcales bacterium]